MTISIMGKCFPVLILLLGMISQQKVASQGCPNDWDEYDGYCWYYSKSLSRDKKASWTGASSFCQANGGYLAIFDTVAQQDHVYDNIRAFQDTDWWIGLSDIENEGDYRWVDGTRPTAEVTKWKQGEPSHTNGEDCVEMWVNLPLYRGRWNDKSCDRPDYFVCRGKIGMVGNVPNCESGWTAASTGCYKSFSNRLQWQEAGAYCRTYGAQLAALTSLQEQQTVASLLQNPSSPRSYWIGLSDTASPGTLQWSTHEQLSYSNFGSGVDPNSPIYTGSSCTIMDYANSYKWDLVKCSSEYEFVCEKGFKATCPTGWTYLSGKCYEFVVNPNRASTWTTALKTCNAYGGGLLKIETEDQQKYLGSALEQYYNSGAQLIWIGGSDVGHDDTLTWWDNSNIAKTYWDINMPKTTKDRYDCMAMYSGTNSLNNWETTSCFYEHQFICELPEGSKLPAIPPVVIDGKCKDGWRWLNNYCFFFASGEKTQPSARQFCQSLSDRDHPSELASILTANEESFIRGHMQQNSWIGLEMVGGTYQWVDSGQPLDQGNWKGSATRSQKCVYVEEDSGLWVDAPCTNSKTFICKTTEISITPITPTPPDLHPDFEKCGGNGWFSDPSSNKCYKVDVDRTRSWNDARAVCRQQGGDLVSVNSPDENNFIAGVVQNLAFAANIWIGASDKMSWQDDVLDIYDGGWSWSDGSPFNYINWNSGEPNNVGGEDCVELYIGTGRWNDLDCAALIHFVCEKTGDVDNFIGTDIAQTECRSNEACCFKHIGVEKGGAVPDSALSASSVRDEDFDETRGRLNMQETIVVVNAGPVAVGAHGAWEPADNDQENSFLQVDFQVFTELKGIITQGRNGLNINSQREWVTSYKVSYSQDPDNVKGNVENWEYISDSNGNHIVFDGNKDRDTQVTNLFPRPIVVRHIRCHPQTYFGHVALRLEYIGCRASCLYSVGMNNGYIPDNMLTASSGDAKQARPPVNKTQCLDSGSDIGQDYRGWLSKTVNGLDCQPWALQSPHRHDYTPQNYPDEGLAGNACRNPAGSRSKPWCYTTDTNVEWEYCNIPTCPSYNPTGWKPTTQSANQWIQVQFDDNYKVSGLTTYSASSYVKTYKLQFSDTGTSFRTYQNQNGDEHIFRGNSYANGEYTDILREPITTRFLRIMPQSWQSQINLQFEINGCYADRLLTCADKGTQFEDDYFTATCPGGCAQAIDQGPVYGTDTYTESSAICPAAIHAGNLINNHGGVVEVAKINGKNSYEGSVRHGISSQSYGVALHSLTFNGKAYRCPDGWYAWNEHCYYFAPNGGAKAWTEARADCKSKGGDLASILTKAENDFLTTVIVQAVNGGDVWIGLNALDIYNYYTWSDGSVVTLTNWWRNEPNDNDEKCVNMYRLNGYWNDKSCETKYPYICKSEKELLPPVTTVTPPIDEGCELGWKGYGYSCYMTSKDRVTYIAANQYCREMGAHLISVQDLYEQTFAHAYITSVLPVGFGFTSWLGITAKIADNGGQTYQWETGEPVSYTYWGDGEPDVLLKCSFPFVYGGNTYYECTTANNILVPGNAPWCSVTSVYSGPFLLCGNENPEGCGYMDEISGQWRMEVCQTTRHYTCEKTRVGYTEPVYTTRDPLLGGCQGDWVTSDNLVYCYQINEFSDLKDRATWQQANDYCTSQRADLVSFHSSNEEAEVAKLVQQKGVYSYASFWTGLNSISNTNGYSWSDGTGVSYTNWAPGEPSDHNDRENCVETQMLDNSQWNDLNCDALRNWICKIRKNVPPVAPPTLPPPGGIEDGGCGNGWIKYTTDYGKEKCYKFVGDRPESWSSAETKCQESGGHLVGVHDQNENTLLLSRAAQVTSSALWIGLRDIGGRSFQWADNSLVDFTNWGPGEPNNYLNNEDCADIAADKGLWNDDNCGLRKPYICEKCTDCGAVVIPPTDSPTGGCPDGFTLYGNKCYYSSGDLQYSWDTASEYCRNMSSELAVVNNEYEQAFLASYMYGVSENVWIGFHSRYNGGPFVWADQSPITYVAWDGGQPDNWENQEGCVELWLGPVSSGRWNDHQCSQWKTFSCYVRRSDEYSGSPPASTIECPSGYYPWNRGCYMLVTEARSYPEAQDYCRTKGNELANIGTVYENELFHSWFWKGQLSSTDYLWTGMKYDVTIGDNDINNTTFSWSNEWPVEYSNWGQGQPATPDASGCVYMDSHGAWFATDESGSTKCSTALPFICKINLDPIPTEPPIRVGYCDPGFIEINNFCYYFNPGVTSATSRSWFEAKAECEAHDADLASFHSSEDLNGFIDAIQGQSSHNLYIGLYSNGYDGWVWSDGSAVEYTNWNDNEPNGQGNGEECGEMYPWNGAWNDVSCYEDRGYVCKKPAGYTRCNVPTQLRIECGFPGISQTYCVTHRGCCYDPQSINANFSGCFWAENVFPTGYPVPTTVATGLSSGAIAGIVIGCLAAVAALVGIVFYCKRSGKSMPSMPAFSAPSFMSTKKPEQQGGFDNPAAMPNE